MASGTSKKRSDIISNSASPIMNMFRKGLLHGAGYDTDDIRTRPLIAIANSHTELTTGHAHLDRLGRKVKDGILAAGGECAEFNVPAPCDGVAMAHDGMRFVLAQRDLIADMVETHVRSQPYDGLVVIAGCDKINPAMMMAAARLDLPTIYLSAGPGQMDIRNTAGQRGTIDHGDYGDDAQLLAVSPNGPYGIQDVWAAGGMPAVLKRLERFLDTRCMTVTGQPLEATVDAARVVNENVIPPVEKAFRPISAITVLRGNLAPDTAIIKQAGVHPSMLHCKGPAVCFNTEEDALAAIGAGRVKQGDVVVLRYLGPKGAPGMPEMLGATMALKMKGLKQAALVTDGRFSGATSGPCVGHICPEASDGGSIALVEDGDVVEIDIPNRKLILHVDEARLAQRRAAWKPFEREAPDGFMRRYRKHVRPACEGAVLE